MNTKTMKDNAMIIKVLATRIGITLFIWQCIACIHLMTWYLDAINFRPEYTLSFKDFLYYFLAYGSWAIFSLGLFECMKRIKLKSFVVGCIVLFLAGLVLWLPSYFAIDYTINSWLNGEPEKGVVDQLVNTSNALVFFYGIVYTLTFVVCISIFIYKNARESQLSELKLRAEQSETQLQLLQSQLGSHFLFNCLGSISALARTDDKNKLLSAVNRVGNLLRYTIESTKCKRISLQDELAFVDDYIALQKLRFEERFEYQSSIDKALNNVQIPPFLIQPLIENAFVHAVAKTESTVKIRLNTHKQDQHLLVSVSNTYIDFEKPQQSFGSAISNLRTRLEMIFRRNYSLKHGRDKELYVSGLSLPISGNS